MRAGELRARMKHYQPQRTWEKTPYPAYTEDSSISTVVIVATEGTNAVRRQTLESVTQPKYTVQAAFR